jgi:gliding motility-associated-like protein
MLLSDKFLMTKARILFTITFIAIASVSRAQVINVTAGQTAFALAQNLAGPGITISNPVLTCPTVANGIFTALGSTLGISDGIILTTGSAATAGTTVGANGAKTLFASTSSTAAGDAFLESYIGKPGQTHDACALEFDFVPAGDTVKFNYTFGSEEYPQYSCSPFNDVFAFFITGPGITGGTKNIALVPNTSIPVSINSITDTFANPPNVSDSCTKMGFGSPFGIYYRNGVTGATYDGFTTVLRAITKVIPCSTYHLKLVIADLVDWSYDSGVWLQAGSLTSNTAKINSNGLHSSTNIPYAVRGCYPGQFGVYRSDTTQTAQPFVVHFVIGGNAINGVDYSFIPDSVIIPVGAGKKTVTITPLTSIVKTGVKTVKIYVLAPSCNPLAPPKYADSATLDIYDELSYKILTPDTAICFGDAVNVRIIGDSAYTYNWVPNTGVLSFSKQDTNILSLIKPDTTTTYQLKASLSVCPDVTKDFTIEVQPIPKIDAGKDTTICQWDSILLHADVKPYWFQSFAYNWSPGTNLNITNKADVMQKGAADTKLTVVVTTPIGCTDSDTVNVFIHPANYSSGPEKADICPYDSAEITITGRGKTFSWTPPEYLNTSKAAVVKASPNGPLVYTVYISDTWGCKDSVKVPVFTHPAGVLYLGDDIHLHPGEKYQMFVKGNCMSYKWFPYIGLSANNVVDPIIAPDVNTRYFVTGTTADGCKVSDTLDVYVDETILDVPNAFTPLGINHELKIVKRGIATLKYFRIFNRWGAKVFETTDVDKGWDGRYNNEDQPMGVYVYTIEAEMVDGRPYKKEGNVTLVR